MTREELFACAREARENAYAPYSDYRVGAAILSRDGRVFLGCNVENMSYGATVCAERAAISAAVTAGATSFSALALVGGSGGGEDNACVPCGMCLQVMTEFFDQDTEIYLSEEGATYTVRDLLPTAFHFDREDGEN